MSYQPPSTQSAMPGEPQFQQFPDYQARQDDDNLRLLSILHYVYGGLTLAAAVPFLLLIVAGAVLRTAGFHPIDASDQSGMAAAGELFYAVGGFVMVWMFVIGGLKIWAGRCLSQRNGHALATMLACLDLPAVPVGTALGVFTLVVLSRPTVKALFDRNVGAASQDSRVPYSGGDYRSDR